jgi:chromosome segregation ATPase
VKDLKKKLDEEISKNNQLQTEFRLLEVSHRRLGEESVDQASIIKEQEEAIRTLREGLAAEKNLLVEKKKKWKGRIADLMGEIERIKENAITLDNKVTNYEQLTVNQDAMISEEKEKILTVENNLSMLKSQLDEARKEALANQEKTQTQETELAELSVRLQYEVRAANDMKATIDELKAELTEKDKAIDELRKEGKKKREKLTSTKDAEISRLSQDNLDLKSALSKAEGRGVELEAALEDIKYKFEDTLRQLNIAEIKLTELVKEKEMVVELKSLLAEKDREIQQKREIINVICCNLET